jgi:pimeloyl-ACP methyl ester carboxylesterase
MKTVLTKTLSMPGVDLSYTLRGSGPLLLLISGGEGGREGYETLATILSDRYTVITYDRRGAPGSKLHDPSEMVTLATHSDDAKRLLDALSTEPVYLFGSSGGALIGLDLAIRYPTRVIILIAHEPPVEGILDEFDHGQQEVSTAFKEGGMLAATKLFFNQITVNYEDLEAGVILPPRNPQEAAIRGLALMLYTFPAAHEYRLDLDALKAADQRVILACGVASQSSPIYRCVQALASQLGTKVVEFPSHHIGYITHPHAFAQRLDEVIKTHNTFT